MRFRLLLTVGLLASVLLLTGCFEDIVTTFDGEPQVEFEQYNQPALGVGSFGNSYAGSLSFAADAEEPASFGLRLNLIGEHHSNDVHINFAAVSEQVDVDGDVVNTASAVEGEHFTLSPGDGQAVFPAGVDCGDFPYTEACPSFSFIEVTALPDGLEPGESVTMILELQESEMLIPAENYKYYTVTLSKASDDG